MATTREEACSSQWADSGASIRELKVFLLTTEHSLVTLALVLEVTLVTVRYPGEAPSQWTLMSP